MGDILVVAELVSGGLKKYSLELSGKARQLADASGSKVTALLIGCDAKKAAEELGHYGVTKVVCAEHEALKNYSSEGYTKILCDVVVQEKPDIVLGTASSMGRDMFARSASFLKAGLASDCIDLMLEGGKLKAVRPVYAGKAVIEVSFEGSPQMATVRPNTFSIPNASQDSPQIVEFNAEPGAVRAAVKEVVDSEAGMVDLSEADRIVSAGRPIGSAENFKMIKDLAKVLNASVGASRAAVDAGFISHDHQVGQTGKTVNPSLYIACGISGSIQHLAGMRTSKVIVAINKDPEAPIFSKADYGIVGDMFKVVPVLTEQLGKLLRE